MKLYVYDTFIVGPGGNGLHPESVKMIKNLETQHFGVRVLRYHNQTVTYEEYDIANQAYLRLWAKGPLEFARQIRRTLRRLSRGEHRFELRHSKTYTENVLPQ